MLKIIFEDSSLLVLDKPSGLVSDPSITQKEDTLADILIKKYGIKLERGGLVHRLDKETSGIILAAKQKEALENLQKQFSSREVKKEYLALVHGTLEKAGRVERAISRNPGNREKFIVLEGGKEAATDYKPIERLQVTDNRLQEIFEGFNKIQMRKLQRSGYGKFTLLRCFPKTGRTHQIRVHLKYLGFPIVADEKYGGRKTVRLDRRWCPRMFLHAAKIQFKHPVSGKVMIFESPLPEDLEEAISKLAS